jgi:hypothetical protein
MRCAIIFAVSLLMISAGHSEPCPAFPLGLVKVERNGIAVFHSTARAEAFIDSIEGIKLASGVASFASRAALQSDMDVPKTPSGHLQGVIQTTCTIGRTVYVTSSVDTEIASAAERFLSNMATQLPGSPTTQPPRQ